VNAPGRSAWTKAPAPETLCEKVSVTGPLPPFPASELHKSEWPAVNPVPAQLHGLAEQATEMTLLAAPITTVTELAIAVVAVKLAANTVPSAPFWDHARLSLAACAELDATCLSVSALVVAALMSESATTLASFIKDRRLNISAILFQLRNKPDCRGHAEVDISLYLLGDKLWRSR